MTGNLVVAIVVITGFALSAVFALNTMDSGDSTATGPASSTPSSTLSGVEAESARVGIIAGCQGGGASTTQCQCIADRMLAAGYDSPAELAAVQPQIETAVRTGVTSGLPAPIVAAYQSCG